MIVKEVHWIEMVRAYAGMVLRIFLGNLWICSVTRSSVDTVFK